MDNCLFEALTNIQHKKKKTLKKKTLKKNMASVAKHFGQISQVFLMYSFQDICDLTKH